MKNVFLSVIVFFFVATSFGINKELPLKDPLLQSRSALSKTKRKVAKIPIIAWIGVLQAYTNVQRYQEMSEAGITESIAPFSDDNSMAAALDIAQKTNIKLFIWCPGITTDPEKTVKRFMNHPALAGYFLQDEPRQASFANLAIVVKKIRAIDNKHPCYINLLPNYADASQLGTGGYQEYLDNFINQVPVQILSFDHYPIIGYKKLDIRPEWYRNLEMISAASKKTGKPFWGFALSTEFSPYPKTSLSTLRLQMFSNLAYGAQAIQYFTYWTVDDVTMGFHNAPITNKGDKTPVYAMIQQVNKEVNAVSGIFGHASLISVSHTGILPPGTKPLNKLPKLIKSLITDGPGAIVSVMKNNGQSYLVIVNRDFTAPMNLTVNCAKGVNRVLKDGSSIIQEATPKTIQVEPGDMTIFKWPSWLD